MGDGFSMKTLVFALGLLTTALIAVAQDLAPLAFDKQAANFVVTSVPASSFTVIYTAGQSFRLSPSGAPVGTVQTFAWQKTSPTTATLTETLGTQTTTTAITFTSASTATFRTTSSATIGADTGTVTFGSFAQPAPLLNISTRAVLAAGQVLNPGFVVGGLISRRVLVRAVGPTLGTAFGVQGSMADPSLIVFRGATQIADNNNWGGAADLAVVFAAVGAFALPVASLDAAVLLTLAPGNYTAQVRGTAAGDVLVEVYFVD